MRHTNCNYMKETLVYLGFGSNQGNRVENINLAIDMLTYKDELTLCKLSSFYDNPPMGNLPQPNYINAVGSFMTKFAPIKLLKKIQSIEFRLGRSKVRRRWDARPIDIDILIYNTEVLDKEAVMKEYFLYIIKNFNKDVKITDFTKHLACIFKGYIGSKHTRAYMCHELNYEREPIKKLEELIFKEDLWKNGQDLYSKVI